MLLHYKAVTRLESLKVQFAHRESEISHKTFAAEKAAKEGQTETSDRLRESMKMLQARIDEIPSRQAIVEARINDTRKELIAVHKEITDDQPRIDEGN